MTKDEAFNRLVETVETVDAGEYESIEQAYVYAARALNYIMDKIDNDNPSS